MDIISEINNAVALSKNREYKKAEEIYLSVLKQDKDNSVVLSLLGLLYMNTGKFKKSEKYLSEAMAIKPSTPAIEGLGIVKSYLKKNKEAVEYFKQIIPKTKSFEVYDRYIKILIESKENSKAHKYAQKCYELYPMKPESLNNLAFTGIHAGKLKEAFKYAQQLVKQHPKYADGWLTYGLVLEMLYHDDENAGNCFKKAYDLGAKEAAGYNLAVSYEKRGEYKKALYYANKLKKINPYDVSLDFLFVNIYFKQRKFKQAEKYYLNYVTNFPLKERKSLISRMKRLWYGKINKSTKNETLFVFCDQGIGDGLMFIRYINFLEKYFKEIKVMCSKKFIELLKNSFSDHKNIKFYPASKIFPRYDKSVILSSLPIILKMGFDNIPFTEKYLSVNGEIIKKYSKKIKSDKLKVGICWESGGIGWRELLNRTLNISLYEPFLKLKDADYFSLQVNPTMDNYKNYDLKDLGKDFKDFNDTAGAIKNLDIVITVDTSVAHLAGALGVKTFMLLPYCPDWRWFDCDNNTDWYKSVRIFKQTDPTNWDEPINRIKNELLKLIKEK